MERGKDFETIPIRGGELVLATPYKLGWMIARFETMEHAKAKAAELVAAGHECYAWESPYTGASLVRFKDGSG